MSFLRVVVCIGIGLFFFFQASAASAADEPTKSAKPAATKDTPKAKKKADKKVGSKALKKNGDKKNKKSDKKNGNKKGADAGVEEAEKEDEFEDEDAFAEKEAAEASAREAEIELAVEEATRKALKRCPKPKPAPKGLLLDQLTMSAGGTITGSYDGHIPVDDGKSLTGGTLTVWPEAGLFVIDQLQLFLGMGFSAILGDISDNEKLKHHFEYWNSFGFNAGLKYTFDLNKIIYPYIGAGFGVDIRFAPDAPEGVEQWANLKYFVVSAPLGVLIGISRHVALDVGVQFEFDISLNDSIDEWNGELKPSHQIHIPFGYLGIHAFFPTKK